MKMRQRILYPLDSLVTMKCLFLHTDVQLIYTLYTVTLGPIMGNFVLSDNEIISS